MTQEKEEFEKENVVYIDDELILKFLKVFSRAEYALKNVKDFRHATKAEANWDKFAKKIGKKFLGIDNNALSEAKKYLWNNPPKKQIIKKDSLFFDDFPIGKKKNTQQLLLMIRTVRNNLFHGGKHTPSTAKVNNADRNQKLIESSIVIIKACMDMDDRVKSYYNVQ